MYENDRKVWFPAKRYGWGWGWPCAWQGWLVFAAFVTLITAAGLVLCPTGRLDLYIATAVALSIALFAVCFAKGEKPRWRWGDEDSKPTTPAARLDELNELRRRGLISESEYQHKRQEILRNL